MAVRLSALRAGHPLAPEIFLVFISVGVNPRASAAGRIRSIEKKLNDLIGT
jgi:hypothetical protein